MKKIYENAQISMVAFNSADVITASGGVSVSGQAGDGLEVGWKEI